MPVAVDVIPASPGRSEAHGPGIGAGRGAPWWASPVGPVLAVVGLATWITLRASVPHRGGRYFMLFDDAMISMRYARNLADGHGLVFNAGQTPVEGYTNFLWTVWMALLHVLPVPTRFVPALVAASGAALVAVTVVLVGRIARLVAARDRGRRGDGLDGRRARDVGRRALVPAAVVERARARARPARRAARARALARAPHRRVGRRARTRDRALRSRSAAGVLTRTDFFVVVPAAARVARLAARSRTRAPRSSTAAVVVGALVAHTVFRLAYYGEALPNTYVLKIEGVSLWTRLDRGIEALGAALVAELAVLVVFAAVACFRRRRDRVTWLLVPPILAAAAYSVWVGGDAWEWTQSANRFLTPVGPLLILLAALGVADVVRMPSGRQVRTLALVAVLAIGAVVVANWLTPNGDVVRASFNLDDFRTLHWLALGAFVALVLGAVLLAVRAPTGRWASSRSGSA